MKKLQLWFISFLSIISIGIFLTPTNDVLEITAHLCHLSEPKEKCYCSEEMEETVWFLQKYRFDKR